MWKEIIYKLRFQQEGFSEHLASWYYAKPEHAFQHKNGRMYSTCFIRREIVSLISLWHL